MKRIFQLLVISCLLLFVNISSAQVTKIPQAAKDNFKRQYPRAENVDWDNDIVNVNVRFTLDGDKMDAAYNNRGIWKSTVKDFAFDKLPAEVQEGFKKSKYADREVTDTKMIYYPADVIRYRLKVEKNDLERKYLFFEVNGRLFRDSITL